MAQYIALAASAMSIVAPGIKKKNGSESSSTKALYHHESFTSGIAMGLSLGLVLSILVSQCQQKYRINERIRYSLRQMLLKKNNTKNNSDLSNCKEIINVDKTQKSEYMNGGDAFFATIDIGEDSIMNIIANCNNTISPNLHCSKITLRKGTKLVNQSSKGVEVYFILHGTADFILQSDGHFCVKAQESILIQPWTSRVIENNSNDDITFLRISDAGDYESRNNANIRVEKIDHQQSTFNTIKEGFKSSIKSFVR